MNPLGLSFRQGSQSTLTLWHWLKVFISIPIWTLAKIFAGCCGFLLICGSLFGRCWLSRSCCACSRPWGVFCLLSLHVFFHSTGSINLGCGFLWLRCAQTVAVTQSFFSGPVDNTLLMSTPTQASAITFTCAMVLKSVCIVWLSLLISSFAVAQWSRLTNAILNLARFALARFEFVKSWCFLVCFALEGL